MINTKEADKKAQSLKLKAIKKMVRKGGMYENFGQSEVRELTDFIGADLFTAEAGVREVLNEFMFWAENYTGNS